MHSKQLRDLQQKVKEFEKLKGFVKRAVENLKSQPKKGVMPWE